MRFSTLLTGLFVTFLVLFTETAFSQVTFRKGYFIDEQGVKTICLIKDTDKTQVPGNILFKMDEAGPIVERQTSTLREFGFEGLSRFIREKVMIDRSSSDLNNLSTDKNPIWSEEVLFLKVLVEGKASLFYYTDAKNEHFFYSVDSSEIKQLVYKKYLVDQLIVGVNNTFRAQLMQTMHCDEINKNELEQLQYQRKALERYFNNFNASNGQTSFQFKEDPERERFHLKLAPAMNQASFVIRELYDPYTVFDYGQNTGFQLGVEAEYILPFNRNKWSLFIEPGFYSFHKEMPVKNGISRVRLNIIEFPVGMRYYLFLNRNTKLYANLLFIPGANIHLNTAIETKYKYYSSILDVNELYNFGGGLGITYKKLNAEFRYYTNRDFLQRDINYYTEYNRMAFILGYRLF
ncbi:MAG: hypothetical protein HOO86_05665 [Bacteroidales bacterium]|nr:hypothetical protein [Bacteroidales bacterium]